MHYMNSKYPVRWFDPHRVVEDNKGIWAYWDGPKSFRPHRLGPVYELCARSLSYHNKDFQVITKEDVAELPGGQEALKTVNGIRCKQWQADYLRLFILNIFGGTWVDMDCLCFAPIEFDVAEADEMAIPVHLGGKHPFTCSSPFFLRKGSKLAKQMLDRCAELAAARKKGSKMQWSAMANAMYNNMIAEGIYPIKKLSCDKYQFTAPDKLMKAARVLKATYTPSRLESFVGPNPQIFHFGSFKRMFSNWPLHKVLGTGHVGAALFRKAFGLYPLLAGRSVEIVRRLDWLPHDDIRVAELGVLEGRTSSAVLRGFGHRLAEYAMVDTWGDTVELSYKKSQDRNAFWTPAEYAEIFEIAKARIAPFPQASMHRGLTTEMVHRFPDEHFDLVFIDADHSYTGCSTDIKDWYPKVKPGCWIGGHDYGMVSWGGNWGVKKAVDEFAKAQGLRVALGTDWVWFVQKPC